MNWQIGDYVHPGAGAEDFDTGKIVDIRYDPVSGGPAELLIAWDSGVRTWQSEESVEPA